MAVTEAPEPEGLTLQVGAWAGEGLTEQLNTTVLLNPPAGFTVTVPVADWPAFTALGENAEALKEKSGGALPLNVAVMVWSTLEVKVHTPVPEQPPPLHPAKLDPEATMAVSVTEVPTGNVLTQTMVGVLGTSQSMPAGLLDTTPLPEPAIVTMSCGS